MKKILDLDGIWTLFVSGEEKSRQGRVPGSVAGILLENGEIPDPDWRDNEKRIQKVFEKDYVFSRTFYVTPEILSLEKPELCCEGLDTIAEIRLNGTVVGKADNMYRTWRFPVKEALVPGENQLEILFTSPLRWVREHPSQIGKPYSAIRKAACMFGWDWGLSLPDSGIWKSIFLEAPEAGRLETVVLSQEHRAGTVVITAEPLCHLEKAEHIKLELELSDPEGNVIGQKSCFPAEKVIFEVKNPRLWYPAGYGEQQLYTLNTRLFTGNQVLDEKKQRLGLRTIRLDREEEGDGAKYSFEVNGIPVFFKGENLVIEDSLLTNTTKERWERLTENCLRSNLNGIRVWGGAYYPPDIFYDLCDEKGILVYQDFMFACSFYQVNREYLENAEKEIAENLSRFAHHACLAVLCGNNEIDGIYTVTGSTEPETAALRVLFGSGEEPLPEQARQFLWANYRPLFLELIPKLCARFAPDTSYVHSSPSSKYPGEEKSFFDYARRGDMHYYLPYNGNAPYQKMRSFRCRFITEMGFQSYPSMKTIHSFTEEEDRKPYTPVMFSHQKCANGNEAIELYMERDYLVPKIFSDYVFLSQLQAGEIMRYSVEHFRRDNRYCRGIILWQLNDCWPVVSWSGIDYYGRWKALQYMIKRFYEPVLISVREEGTQAELWVSNETPQPCQGKVFWTLYGKEGSIFDKGELEFAEEAGESRKLVTLDYGEQLKEELLKESYLHFGLVQNQRETEGTVLFCLPKEFHFRKPKIRISIEEQKDCFAIELSSDCFVKAAGLDLKTGDAVFSDNYFDLIPGRPRTVLLEKQGTDMRLESLKEELRVTTLNDVMLRAQSKTEGECNSLAFNVIL